MPSRSQILAPTSSQIERAWHLLTVLVRLGRPASPAELASRSALDSIFLTPNHVEFLSRIPGSPISLTRDRLITISEVAVVALDQFLGRTFRSFVPRVSFGVSEQRRDWNDLRLMYVRKRKVRSLEPGLVGPIAKRRLFLTSKGDVEEARRDDQLGIHSSTVRALKVHNDIADTLANSLSAGVSLNVLSQGIALTPSIPNDNSLLLSFEIKNDDHLRRDGESEKMPDNAHTMILGQELPDDSKAIVVQKELCDTTQAITIQKVFLELFGCDGSLRLEQNGVTDADTVRRLKMSEPDIGPALLDKAKDKPVLWMETLGDNSCIVPAAPLAVSYEVKPVSPNFLGAKNNSNGPSAEIGSLISQVAINKNEIVTEVNYLETEGISFHADASRREQEESALKVTEPSAPRLGFYGAPLSAEPGPNLEQQKISSKTPNIMDRIASIVEFQRSVQESNIRRNDNSPKCEQDNRNEKGAFMKQNMRRSRIVNMPPKGNKQEAAPKISKFDSASKLLPSFESFVIEEEEGSGGYGTVYRARRKEDGKIFAVKYPHPNAHSHHVNNELKMLERFGGRNFVIKFEGSFKSGQSECFVLEHVEHDRPEVLKKDIDIFELQWYGYCMFRALASLHKQGIVHRDVKPGNFLFSRKLNKGYLIDFNLASDLHQKYSKSSNSGNTSNANLDPFSLSSRKSSLYNQPGNVRKDRALDISNEVANDSKKILLKSMKKKSSKGHIETFLNIDSSNKHGSQAADSGVTSAKDPTSTRTHSADRLKQPIPYKGRKELINFVHEAMQSPDHKEATGPVSQRKRVAAPGSKLNSRLMILTPMPLHSGGNAIAGAGVLRGSLQPSPSCFFCEVDGHVSASAVVCYHDNPVHVYYPGNGKRKREGPCVGTKGFRAPEVLFKSCHQGCKVDIWSAGVTLLYLIIGKTPFGGDPEQNMKEIAKLRGSEDLWEVAKLHNCESSYPPDLLDVQFLRTTELRHWCSLNTKRPEFLEQIPQSLFDLVDKCLTVNPRRRITAEEALMHSFFTPCHESLRKQRLLRIAAGSES